MRIGPRISSLLGSIIGPRSNGLANTTLTVDLADNADPVITGADPFAYTAVVQNTGGAAASSVTLTITLDASLTYVSASGTGWSISRSGQVVTCTLTTLAAGATANTVTVNVTTGTGALTASTSASVSATNTTAAGTDTETTVVDLVTKDATAGIYFPANSTEWTKFIARKGLSISVPDSLHGFQDASGNITDQIGSITLTANGSSTYQQSVSGYSRKAVVSASGSAFYRSSSASLPDPASASCLSLVVSLCTSSGTASFKILQQGSSAYAGLAPLFTTGVPRGMANGGLTTVDGTVNCLNRVVPYSLRYNKTGSTITAFTDGEKLSPAFTAASGKQITVVVQVPASTMYAVHWFGAKAEVSDANYKAMLQALGWTISWS